jgi:16S rRNA processing protein RimM
VAVTFTSNRPERWAVGARLWAGGRELLVSSARRHRGRWLLRFEGVTGRNAAEELQGVVLEGEPLGRDTLGEREIWVHDLLGCDVVDRDGRVLGTVDAVEANPAHDLLVLDGGALIPMVFVVEHDASRVVVDVPDGLVE